MRDIYLHGAIGEEFGRHHRFDVESVTEVISALRANFPRFTNAIRHGFYRVVLGKLKGGLQLDEEGILMSQLGDREVHIVPVLEGRKRGGLGKIVAGIALVGLSLVPGAAPLMGASLVEGGMTIGAMVGNMGMAMILTGVATMIAPEQEAADDKKSFTMSGPVSNLREGNIMPIAYGEVITGGYMLSGGVEINGPRSDDSSVGNGSNPNDRTGGSAGSSEQWNNMIVGNGR